MPGQNPASKSTRAAIELPEGVTLEDLQQQLQALVESRFNDRDDDTWSWVEATMDGSLVVRIDGDDGAGTYRIPWSMVEGEPVLGEGMERVEKRTEYVLADEPDPPAEVEPTTASLTLEVVGSHGDLPRKLRVRVIGAGFGLNFEDDRQWYVPPTEEGLGTARKTFGGARVHWTAAGNGELNHFSAVHGREAELFEWLGSDHDAGYLSDLEASDDGLYATLNLDDDVPRAVVEALASKRVGLSIEAMARRTPATRHGRPVVELTHWSHYDDKPASVAVVTHPALRGEVISIAASVIAQQEDAMDMTLDEAKAVLLDPASTAEQVAEARKCIEEHAAKGDGKETEAAKKAADPAPEATAAALAEVKRVQAEIAKQADELRKREDLAVARETLGSTSLSEARRKRLELQFKGRQTEASFRGDVATKWLTDEIEAETEILRGSDERVHGSSRVVVGAGGREKLELRLERLILGSAAPASVMQAYAERNHGGKGLTAREVEAGIGRNDREWSYKRVFRDSTGFEVEDLQRDRATFRKVQASISSSTFGDALENVLNRAMLAYFEDPNWADWRKLVRPVTLTNVRKQERIVRGGYANLPSVAEGANYTAATTPGDEGHGYTPLKYGYTEDWTFEAQFNDDVRVLQDIPRSMGQAALRTIYENVFDLLTDAGEPTMDYDATVLFDNSGHANKATSAALAEATLAAGRLAMRKQTDLTTGKRMGILPRFLLVPPDLEETAYNLVKPKAEEPGGLTTERSWLRNLNLEVIVVRHWTDANDWVLAADPMEHDCFEWGFLQGRQEPEFFIQDDQNVGSVFNADKVTYKIRQPHNGGAPLRHEYFYLGQG